MARKRLSPAAFSMELRPEDGPRPPARPPIAHVAGDSAAAAALTDLTEAMDRARADGRMIVELPLDRIDAGYLVRDRIEAAPDEMAALVASIARRGQQVPVEVVALEDGRYGLISGWRRLLALRQLAEDGTPRPALAVLRRPEDRAAAWQAMVEENEIRADLSFYERARIVARAVETGVYDGEKAALQGLFPDVSYARRSKIKSFLGVVAALDGVLRHPARIPERLGLALARGLEEPAVAKRLRTALADPAPRDAEAEARLLAAALKPPRPATPAPAPTTAAAAATEAPVTLTAGRGRAVLSGPGVTPAFLARLERWLAETG